MHSLTTIACSHYWSRGRIRAGRAAHSLAQLAKLYSSQGKQPQAETLYRQALKIRENALGPEHPDVASLLRKYDLLLISMKRKDEAV